MRGKEWRPTPVFDGQPATPKYQRDEPENAVRKPLPAKHTMALIEQNAVAKKKSESYLLDPRKEEVEVKPVVLKKKERERKRRREDEEAEEKTRNYKKEKFHRDQRAEYTLPDIPSTVALSTGMIVLAAISKITAFEMQVWIPGGNVGTIRKTDISDVMQPKELSTFFKVGSLIKCVIKSMENETLYLSLCESLLNANLNFDSLTSGSLISGSVKSIEDHGYFISLGSQKHVGFLPKKETSNFLEDAKRKELLIGEPLVLSVTSVRSSSLTLSLNNIETNRDAIVENRDQSLEDILVGSMVKVSILKILKNGLLVSLFGRYAGRISRQQVDFPIQKLSENFDIGEDHTARIIYINKDNKEIGLSVKSHIIYYSSLPFPSLKAGDMLPDARAKKPAGTKLRRELYMELSGDNPQPVFLPAGAHPLGDVKPKYKDDVVPCRITGVDIFSGIIRANAQPSFVTSVIQKEYAPGDIVVATVYGVEANRIKLHLSGKIYAFCDKVHYDEPELPRPKNFVVGDRFDCRVINVTETLIKVTLKPTMINSKLPVLDDYEAAVPEARTTGFVSEILADNYAIEFYRGVKGRLSKEKVEGTLKLGSVVDCEVVTRENQDIELMIAE